MTRFLLLCLLGWLAYRFMRRLNTSLSPHEPPRNAESRPEPRVIEAEYRELDDDEKVEGQ